jgi:halimadienyl-diphosphate synthase
LIGMSFKHLLKEIGPGRMTSTAYHTAWAARLAELGEPLGERALEWLRAQQLPDGSWGAAQPVYYHDRLISTLAAATALAQQGSARDRAYLRRAQDALEVLANAEKLNGDPAGATVGFELIVPTLVAEAEALGIIHHKDSDLLDRLSRQRAAKLAALPGGTISRFVTVAYSAEMAGTDGLRLLDIENLQETTGAVGSNPSATAYFALYVARQEPLALKYLREVAVNDDGGMPEVAPFDVFELAWVLWNLSLTRSLDGEALDLCQPHLDFLEAAWKPGLGIGFAAAHSPTDSDDTGLVYEVLARFGRSLDLEALLRFEEADRFRLYPHEANPSISANVHVLGALRQAGFEARHASVQKILGFLQRTQTPRRFWLDKLHVSPYYPATHAVSACAGYADDLVDSAVRWIVETQNVDGSWGYYAPTAEETAYCLQALAVWKRQGGPVSNGALKRGADWLAEHADPPYPPLWIGKCLYCPELVIRSAILSALALAQEERQRW